MKTHNLYSDDNAPEQTYSDWEGKSWAEAATPKPNSATESEQDQQAEVEDNDDDP